LIKLAMIRVQAWLEEKKMKSLLVLQVHDELVLEVPEDEVEIVKATLPTLMQEVAQLSVPLLAEVGSGDSWESAH
jgi:DNA polymerase-1